MMAKEIAICKHCLSPDVTRDALAAWDENARDWSLTTVLDNADCQACGADGDILTFIEVGGEASDVTHKAFLARTAIENWCINSGVSYDDVDRRACELLEGVFHLLKVDRIIISAERVSLLRN